MNVNLPGPVGAELASAFDQRVKELLAIYEAKWFTGLVHDYQALDLVC